MIQRRTPLKRSTTPLKRTPLRRVSKKRRKEMDEYSHKRRIFLERNRACQVALDELGGAKQYDVYAMQRGVCFVEFNGTSHQIPASEDIHHTLGRTGTNYLDENTWLAVSRANHERIHQNPSWARAHGYLV